MNQILDETDNALMPKRTFSKLAFGAAIISDIVVSYYVIEIPSHLRVSDINKSFIKPLFPIILPISCFFGFIFSVISFAKEEPYSGIKWIAAIINVAPLLFAIFENIFGSERGFNP